MRMRMLLQHFFNPLHVFCRLKEWGVAARTAQRVCLAYERTIYRALR
ncbi:MAG: hypothetical protein ACNI3A_19485 [Desulfovibrio sp.]